MEVPPTSAAAVARPGVDGKLGNVKGAAVREFLVWYQQRFGADGITKLLKHVPPAVQHRFDAARPDLGILASAWYPAEIIHAYCDALVRVHQGFELDAILKEGVAFTMKRNLESLYKRFFIKVLLSPERYVKFGQSLWGMHFDNGALDVRWNGPNTLHWTVDGWQSHHRILCQMVTLSEPSVFGAMGCKHVSSVEKGCVAQGDPRCVHVIRWSNSA